MQTVGCYQQSRKSHRMQLIKKFNYQLMIYYLPKPIPNAQCTLYVVHESDLIQGWWSPLTAVNGYSLTLNIPNNWISFTPAANLINFNLKLALPVWEWVYNWLKKKDESKHSKFNELGLMSEQQKKNTCINDLQI